MSDIISRQYSIKRFCEDGTWLERQGVTTLSLVEAKQRAVDLLESFPSADRPTGRWVRKTKEINDCDGHRAYYWYECDNCGARPPKDQWGHEWHSDFCPNCGSRNIEGDQE